MKQKIKSILFYLPKVTVLGLALLNLLYIQFHTEDKTTGGVSFPAWTPWYDTSDFTYVLVILAASIFLFINSQRSYIYATILSVLPAVIGVVQLFFRQMTLLERWQGIREYELNIFLQIEVQWIFAMAILVLSLCYLTGDFLNRRRRLMRAAPSYP